MLSVTIKARNAAIADAYATSCMVLGPEEGRFFIEERIENAPQYKVDALFILGVEDGFEVWASPGWESEITLLD